MGFIILETGHNLYFCVNLDFRLFKNKDLVHINRKVTPLAKVLAKGEWSPKWAVKKDDDHFLKAWNQLEQVLEKV